MTPVDALEQVGALLNAATTAPAREVRALYLAAARTRLDAAKERAKQLEWLLASAEDDMARAAEDEGARMVGADRGRSP